MAVIDEFIYVENGVSESKEEFDGQPIKDIEVFKTNYHFARENESTNGICDNAVEEPIIDMKISGNSVQKTYTGKNLIPRNLFTSTTKNGITLEPRSDGTIRVYGTATADTVFNPRIYGLQPNTYCLSGCPVGGSNTTYRLLAYFTAPTYNLVEHGEGKSYKLTTESDAIIEIKVYSGITLDVVYKPMLEIGSVKTEYEPYFGGTASPNPEYPQEIESVGEKTINLFDIKTAVFGVDTGKLVEMGEDYFIIEPNTTASNAEAGSPSWSSGWVPLRPKDNVFENGKTYTISYDVEMLEKKVDFSLPVNQRVFIYDTNETMLYRFECSIDEINKVYHYSQTVTVNDFLRFIITCNSSKIKISKFIIVEGSEEKQYEPYGYKIPVKLSGKNLIDTDSMIGNTFTKDGSGNYNLTRQGNIRTSGAIDAFFKKGTQLTLSAEIIGATTETTQLFLYMRGEGSDTQYITITQAGPKKTVTLSFDITRLQLMLASSSTEGTFITFKKLQLEVGSSQTEFEPYIEPTTTNIYLNEPLRKVAEYADYIDYKNKKVVRNVIDYTFTGTEILSQLYETNTTGQYRIFLSIPNAIKGNVSNKVAVLSNLYAAGTADSTYIRKQSVGLHANGYVVVYDANYQKLESFKTFVTEKYNSDTPFIVYYPLATPTEETIEIPEISTFDGTNIFDVETTIEPSKIVVDYWKQILAGVESIEEITQDGSSLLIINTSANITQDGSTLTIGE